MPHNVRRRARAKADQLDIWLYIASHNVPAADRLVERFDEAVAMLADFPEAGRSRPELGADLRSLPVDHCAIFYRVLPDHVEIVRIFSSFRDISPETFYD